MIGRREFILALGGAAAAWPLTARAQQTAMPVIGFLHPAALPDVGADRLRGFSQGLKDSGYVEGENVTIIYRLGGGAVRSAAGATELVDRRVAVIVAIGNATTTATKARFWPEIK